MRGPLFSTGALRAVPYAVGLMLALSFSPSGAPTASGSQAAGPVRLQATGPVRQLPQGIGGASSEPLIEHLIGNPAKTAAIKEVAPAILRFPGGSQSNFYDWRTGLLDFHAGPQSSQYVKFWAQAARRIATAFPRGIRLEDYAPFARATGADLILVPNLETSTVDSQVAWFKDLAAKGLLSGNIELGNEFWIAMGSDPDSLRRWPDEPAAMGVMHRYEQALRPITGPGAKFAVQAAAAAFWVGPAGRGVLARRLGDWDGALREERWFDAVTIHLYPTLEPLQRLAGGDTHAGLFRYLMARCDGGVDRAIQRVSARVPGKEIWVTEWSAHGAGNWAQQGAEPVTPPMFVQAATRMLLAILRHPGVTRELFFTLNFDPPKQSQFVREGGAYRPEPIAQVLGWFNAAANGGARFQRVVERGATPVSPGVPFGDSYREVEGGLFVAAGRTTLIFQHAGGTMRSFEPTDGGRLPAPTSIEIVATSDLNDSARRPVQVNGLPTAGAFTVPPFSVVRITWPGEVQIGT